MAHVPCTLTRPVLGLYLQPNGYCQSLPAGHGYAFVPPSDSLKTQVVAHWTHAKLRIWPSKGYASVKAHISHHQNYSSQLSQLLLHLIITRHRWIWILLFDKPTDAVICSLRSVSCLQEDPKAHS
jgi:hypothetical protein